MESIENSQVSVVISSPTDMTGVSSVAAAVSDSAAESSVSSATTVVVSAPVASVVVVSAPAASVPAPFADSFELLLQHAVMESVNIQANKKVPVFFISFNLLVFNIISFFQSLFSKIRSSGTDLSLLWKFGVHYNFQGLRYHKNPGTIDTVYSPNFVHCL